MSRTDRHRPHRVQAADPYEQRWYQYWAYKGKGQYAWEKVFLYRFGCSSARCLCKFPDWDSARVHRRRSRHQEQRRNIEVRKGFYDAWDI